MKRLFLLVGSWLMIITTALATFPDIPWVLRIEMDKLSYDSGARTANLSVRFFLNPEKKYQTYKEYKSGEVLLENLQLEQPIDWHIEFTNETEISREIRVKFSESDTAMLQLRMLLPNGKNYTPIRKYFVAGDTLEVWQSDPRNSVRITRPEDPDFDTLSAEVLATKYELRIDLRKEDARRRAKEYFGYEPKLERDNYFTVTLPLSELVRLAREYKLGYYYLDPPDWLGTTDSPKAKKSKNPPFKKKTDND